MSNIYQNSNEKFFILFSILVGSYMYTNIFVTDVNIKSWFLIMYVVAMFSGIIILDNLEKECYINNNISVTKLNSFKTYLYISLGLIPIIFNFPYTKYSTLQNLLLVRFSKNAN